MTGNRKAGRPFAAFDIDGTIIRWQLYHAIADELAKRGLIEAEAFKIIKMARANWKNRRQEDSFEEYENQLVKLIDGTITKITPQELEESCQAVLNKYKEQVYTYTRDLIKQLKNKNYLLFAISASQIEIVSAFSMYYEFDDFGGSTYETIANHFTGKKKLLWSSEKQRYLYKLVELHNATWDKSIAVGDSESDIPLLSSVENPIAFNPTKKLFNYAQKNRWNIVLERKNVIYRLESNSKNYILRNELPLI
jgi:HAD superfamily hydrolase (TIGR01490 family)